MVTVGNTTNTCYQVLVVFPKAYDFTIPAELNCKS
jgi:hypothetical protein